MTPDFLNHEINMLTGKARYDFPIIESVLHQAGVNCNHSLLDIGCGPGSSTFVINEILKKAVITGIDTKEEFINYAKNVAQNIDTINFMVSDIGNIISYNEQYDTVFSRNLFNYISDPSNIIYIMKRLTKRSGKICVLEEDEHLLTMNPNPEYLEEMKNSLLRLNKYIRSNKFELHKLSAEMVNQGIKNVKVKTYQQQICDVEGYNYILKIDEKTKWLLEHLGLLPPKKVDRYNQSILEQIEKKELICNRTIISVTGVVE